MASSSQDDNDKKVNTLLRLVHLFYLQDIKFKIESEIFEGTYATSTIVLLSRLQECQFCNRV